MVAYPYRFHLVFRDGVGIVIQGLAPGVPSGDDLAFRRRLGVPGQPGDVPADLLDIGRDPGRLAHGGGVEVRFADVGVVQPGHGEHDAEVDVGQGPLDGVAALEHGEARPEHVGQPGVALGREGHVRDGVGKVVVLAGGVDDEIGLEVLDERQDDLAHGEEEALVRGAGRQGHVDRGPEGPGAAHLVGVAGAGVEGAAVLVQRDEQGVRVVPVDVLGAVAVMAVGVHDGHAQRAEVFAQPFDHDGFDVDVAEPARAVDHLHGVVPGGADQGEGLVGLLLQDRPGRPDGPAGGDHVGGRGHGGHVREAEVDAGDILGRGQVGLEFGDAGDVEDAFLAQLVLGVEQPFLALGVGGGNGPVVGREKDDAKGMPGLQHGWDTAFL